jgi:hypothetical protein
MLEMQLKGLEQQIVVEEKKQELQGLQDAELSLSTMEAELTKAKEDLETAEEHWRDEYEPWTKIIPDDDRGQQISRLVDLIKTSKRAVRQERMSTQEKIQLAVAEEIEKHKPLHDAGIAIRLRRIQYNLPPHERNDNIMYMGNKVSHYGCALEDALMLAAKPNPAFEKVRFTLCLRTPLYLRLNIVFSSSIGIFPRTTMMFWNQKTNLITNIDCLVVSPSLWIQVEHDTQASLLPKIYPNPRLAWLNGRFYPNPQHVS